MQVKDMTVNELKALIRQTVAETLEEFLDDPDSGLELKEEVRQQLIESQKRREAGIRGVPAEEVAQKLGLTW
ncbi:MAG: hypothetical protein F6K47_31385 [Symploca sp. SIO2E6]|nr:hypothetical protein [Symploca sp. SIO2E6]